MRTVEPSSILTQVCPGCHRLNHRVHGKLIIEILIEFAVAALVVMGASAEFNVADHVMQTGLFPGWQFT
jgi:hypothetical protein